VTNSRSLDCQISRDYDPLFGVPSLWRARQAGRHLLGSIPPRMRVRINDDQDRFPLVWRQLRMPSGTSSEIVRVLQIARTADVHAMIEASHQLVRRAVGQLRYPALWLALHHRSQRPAAASFNFLGNYSLQPDTRMMPDRYHPRLDDLAAHRALKPFTDGRFVPQTKDFIGRFAAASQQLN